MKEMLLDIFTHDLKNPAGAVSGLSEIIRDDYPDTEEMQMIYDSSQSLLRTVENVQTLSQVAMKEDIELREINLSELVSRVIRDFNIPSDVYAFRLETDIPPEIYLRTNPIIAEVVKNYASNAIKHGAGGSRINVRLLSSATETTIEVLDWGTTIPEKDRKKVFQRKVQLGRHKRSGRGLGLSIAKRIADALGAEVGVRPNQPSGNIFFIRFPQ